MRHGRNDQVNINFLFLVGAVKQMNFQIPFIISGLQIGFPVVNDQQAGAWKSTVAIIYDAFQNKNLTSSEEDERLMFKPQ